MATGRQQPDAATLAAQRYKALIRGAVAAWPEPDPAAETIPSALGAPRPISRIPDAELERWTGGPEGEQLLEKIRTLAESLGVVLAGDAPARPVDSSGMSTGQQDQAIALNRATLRLRALRAEAKRRAIAAREHEWTEEQRDAARFERLLAEGPGQVAKLAELAAEANAAMERVGRLARDLSLISDAARIHQRFDTLRAAILESAAALQRPVPDLPAMPEPADGSSQYLVRLLADGNLLEEVKLPDDLGASRALSTVDNQRRAGAW